MNPIKAHETWNIQDSTKLQTFMKCPRLYFYQYILGWQPTGPNIHLEFGQAWHLAMETLLLEGYNEKAIVNAYRKLEEHYRKFFNPVMDNHYYPKTPGFAAEMLIKYVNKYADDHENFDVVYTEISGSVPVSVDMVLHFKTDSILRHKRGPYAGKYVSLEHKTAKSTKFSWSDQWALKMQVGVYTHVLNCLFDPAEVAGVIINGAQFQKTDPNFTRLWKPKTNEQMQVWHTHTLRVLESLSREFELMHSEHEEDDVMQSFWMNTESCIGFGTCSYHQFCTAWPNPLRRAYEAPSGFEERFWNPAALETTHKMAL